MAQKSRELKALGHDIVSLTLGEPDFDTPDFIKDAAKEGIDQNYTHYMPIKGYPDLREAISNKFKRVNGLDYSPNQIVVSNGAKQSIANAVLSLVDPGDEVIIPAPYFASYAEQVKLVEGTVIEVKTSIQSEFKITPDQLRSAMTERSRLMIFSSPSNPAGAVYSREELKALAEVIAEKPDFYVISDEIYEFLNYTDKGGSLAQNQEIYDQVITVNGLSKGYAMTGWRLGYMGAPQWIADACDKIQSQFTSGAGSISQRAAIAAVNADQKEVQYMIDDLRERRTLIMDRIKEIKGFECHDPEGAFYAFVNVQEILDHSEIKTDVELCYHFLEKHHVAAVPGTAFGLPGNIRFSYATSRNDIVKAMDRLNIAVQELLK